MTPSEGDLLVVGIGLGAGGLEALCETLATLPAQANFSYVVVRQKQTFPDKQVLEALERFVPTVELLFDRVRLRPGRLLLVPSGASARFSGEFLEPVEFAPNGRGQLIDSFFESLALNRGSQAVAILLGGEQHTDGEAGILAVRAQRGLTLMLHPGYLAPINEQPRSGDLADLTLGPVEIADYLDRFSNTAHEDDPFLRKESELQAIFALLHGATSVDFESYKWSTVRRRLLKRMLVRQTPHLPEYVEVLRQDPLELSALYSELLIGVTELFRDPEVFKEIERTVIPSIIDNTEAKQPVRIWVPGCSSGDEVFSLAICFLEAFRQRGVSRALQLFATDLNESALSRARSGRYPTPLIESLPVSVQGYFVKLADGYQISRSVRELCVFARQDVTQDPPFSHLDLVSCRNLMIYLSVGLQKRTLHHFHYALRQEGFLLLGSSESLGDCEPLFTTISKKHKIFQKRAVPTPSPLNFSRPFAPANIEPHYQAEAIGHLDTRENDVQKQADRLILARYSPPGVIVDENYEIIQFRGRTGGFLEPPVGAATHNILKMAREGLLAVLKAAMEESMATQSAVRRENLQVHNPHGVQRLNLDIVPIRLVDSRGKYLLILFEESFASGEPQKGEVLKAEDSHKEIDLSVEAEILYLRHELLATREYLSSIIQERESSNEELKAANEEAQSANEELQSANEELATINEEVHERNLQLHRANSDLNNILSSVEMPVIILDCDLMIRRFTPSAHSLLNVIPGDIGRPFYQVRAQIEVPDLEVRVREVLETLVAHELEQESNDGRWFSVQIRPYRTVDNRIDGVVIGFVDITDLKQIKNSLDNSEQISRKLLEISPHALAIVNQNMEVVEANSRFQANFPAAEGRLGNRKPTEVDGFAEEVAELLQTYALKEKTSDEEHRLQLLGQSETIVGLRQIKLTTGFCYMLEIKGEGVSSG